MTLLFRTAFLLLLLAAAFPAMGQTPTRVIVFQGGQEGYATYRIPALVATGKGTLLAFAEGRVSMSDHAQNQLVLKRSVDAGKTWLPLQVVAVDGNASLNNPCVAVLDSGRIVLLYQRYPADRGEAKVLAGITGEQTCLCFMTTSDDDGLKWSKPIDITPQVKRPTVATSIAGGPGIGIVLRHGKHAGRIVFPFNQQGPRGKYDLYSVFSDDGGKSWNFGDLASCDAAHRGNEVQCVELSDGRVMLNSRWSSGKHVRKIAISDDGGQTWSAVRDDAALPDSQCMASILRVSFPDKDTKGIIVYSGPADKKSRTIGTIRLSEDDGQTWPHSCIIQPGDFAYSCLATMRESTIGCLYEGDNYKTISFVRFTIDWVKKNRIR